MNPQSPSSRSRWAGLVLDGIYPSVCAMCRCALRGGVCLCGDCSASLVRLSDPFCAQCGNPFDGPIGAGYSCQNCHGHRHSFAFARPVLVRDVRVLRLIHRFKYGKQIHLAQSLGVLAAEALADARFAEIGALDWPLVPVPLHRSRARWRTFNQAEEIAREMAKRTGQKVILGLKRVRATETQTHFGRRQRLENLKHAFAIRQTTLRRLRAADGVILIDDVLTTGATLDACATALRKAGVRVCAAITIMRG